MLYEVITTIALAGSDNPAGSDGREAVHSGLAVKTFTGAKMPEGADTLIPIENVTVLDGASYNFV